MRIGLAQLNPLVGDVDGNTQRVREMMLRARNDNVDLVVFTELVITGYPPKDLVLRSQLVDRNIAAIHQLAGTTKDGPTAVVGFVDRNNEKEGATLFNAAAVLTQGTIAAIAHKSLLPTYDVFDEHRYFEPAESSTTFELQSKHGPRKIGITICEDAWTDETCFAGRRYRRKPVQELGKAGVDLVINLSASPFVVGKQAYRETLVSGHAKSINRPMLLVNQVGGNDELLFDGASFMCDSAGRLVHRAAAFREDFTVVEIDTNGACRGMLQPYPDEIASIREALVLGTRDYVRKCGFENVVLGLSGGIDSAVTCAIAVEALGAEHVLGVAMPSRYSSDHSISDAEALAKALGIEIRTIAIRDIHTAVERDLAPHFDGHAPGIAEENIQARIRGNILMALSNKFGRLLLTTGNKSEIAVGYCTLYGDMCGGLAVISDLPKTTVYDLARHMNEHAKREIIPLSTIEKPPSAELRPDQHDQQSLPPYSVLDAILHRYVELDESVEEIIAGGYDAATVRKVARLVDLNEYKRKQMATGLKVTSRAFGIGRRMPIAARF
ncbi:MAG: NAD+ synthase [Phycisphaerales bacterium]|nr:NAD+ synthase [Phycisphaerales bacterium]